MCRKVNDVVISGTLLLDSLLSHLTTPERENCKAVYLHVLTTNFAAMKFYDKRHFKQFRYLPLYYAINGIHKDGFSYVLYINGGEPPWTLGYPLWNLGIVWVLCQKFGICFICLRDLQAYGGLHEKETYFYMNWV